MDLSISLQVTLLEDTGGPVMPYMVPPTVGPAGPSTAPYMVRGTIHGAVDGPAGPSMAAYMVRPDHPWQRIWSGRTIHGAVHGPAGPSAAPWMVPFRHIVPPPDHIRHYGWSGRTIYGAMDGPPLPCNVLLDYLWRRKLIPIQ